MSPSQLKELEQKVDRLQEKLDFVVKNLSFPPKKKDWLEDPVLIRKLDTLARDEEPISEDDIR